MKILIVNLSDIDGGAGRAVYRLHQSFLSQGVDSQILVQNKYSDDFTVLGPETKFEKIIARIRPIVDAIPVKLYKNRTKTLVSPAWVPFSNIVKKINEINPDIVHLHWVCNGMMSLKDFTKIKAPIVWSLHDMWAFTGGCHYSEECSRYKEDCGCCKVLGSNKVNDLSKNIWNNKKKNFSKIPNITIVAVSRWLGNCAKESSLFRNRRVISIPNSIDTSVFNRFDIQKSRELWSLPQDKKLVLFGAIRAVSDQRKGFKELTQALNKLKDDSIELIVFGSNKPQIAPKLKHKIHYISRLHDDISLKLLYNAADVMVVPSLQEAFGLTASESMSCGTPVVAFGTTGLLDIVDHKENGYLAQPFEIDDLARGIDWVLNNNNHNILGDNARKKVLREFDMPKVAKQYKELYEEILRNKV